MGSAASSERNVQMGRINEDSKIYKLVDMHGSGELVQWMRYARTTGDHSLIDAYIEADKINNFMYQSGKGKVVAVTELVKIRNKERNAMLGAFRAKKGKGKSGPNVLDDLNQEGNNVGDLKKALKLLDGGGKGGKGESKYREIAWKLDERGAMGETLVGACLMQCSDTHNDIALKLMKLYPALINDVHVSEEYYGLSPLHQAIVNEDVRMVATLLRMGADVNQRCYGAFFGTDDQKSSRTDSLEHEYVELNEDTTYSGNMYFGEYPLSFAVSLSQEECVRLLVARKALINAQDTNGNTAAHICVIHENIAMLRLCIELGASLRILNKQKLTPLTLAAKMAKKSMFIELLDLAGEEVWTFGDASQTAYPLARIDTIDENGGQMDEQSALSLVVYGETKEHLDLLDGLLESIVQAKWDAYAKRAWIKSTLAFSVYYFFFFNAFMMRPFSMTTYEITSGMIDGYGKERHNLSTTLPGQKQTSMVYNNTQTGEVYDERMAWCHLAYHSDYAGSPWYDWQDRSRMISEAAVVLMMIIQTILDLKDIRGMGRKKWFYIMKSFPAKLIYKSSFFLFLAMVPCRLLCATSRIFLILDNTLAVISVICTTLHFLYYCRAIKFIGPFVLMVYRIITVDLSRFFLIYSIFLIGFSQSFNLIFTACEREEKRLKDAIADLEAQGLPVPDSLTSELRNPFENIIVSPWDAMIRIFIMTIGEFLMLYRQLNACPSHTMRALGKATFLVYEMCVSILQFNLLIAMMTRTYEAIFQTQKEYKRQWAQVILMLELSLSPKERLMYLLKYSRPVGINKRMRSFVVNRKLDPNNMEEHDIQKKEEKRKRQIEEKKALAKRRQKDQILLGVIRPTTTAGTMGEDGLRKRSHLPTTTIEAL